MKYRPPYGASDPEAPYVNGNPAIGLKGSIIDGRSLEEIQRELVDFVTRGGLTPSFTDLGQLAKAQQTGKINHAVAGGTANALTATLSPVPPALVAGMVIRLLVAEENTDAATLSVGTAAGAVVKAIKRANGSATEPGDLSAGMLAELGYDGTAWQIVNYGKASGVLGGREVLAAPRTYFVAWSTGSDTNNGLTSGTAFKTIQRAVDVAQTLNLNGYDVTVSVADSSSYPSVVLGPVNGAGTVKIVGNVGSPGSVVVTGYNVPAFMVLSSQYTIDGVKVVGSGSNACGVQAIGGFRIAVGSIDCGACSDAHFFAQAGAAILIKTSVRVTGGASTHMRAYASSVEINPGTWVDIPSGVSIGTWAVAGAGGLIGGSYSAIYSPGNVSGSKHYAYGNGVIDTGGYGTSYFPGSTGGSIVTGGQFL